MERICKSAPEIKGSGNARPWSQALLLTNNREDYSSLYVDFANDAALLSRRQLAADMGFEETRLIMWLRKRFKGDPAMLAKIDAIVKEAADKGTMSAMDSAHHSLLALVPTRSSLVH